MLIVIISLILGLLLIWVYCLITVKTPPATKAVSSDNPLYSQFQTEERAKEVAELLMTLYNQLEEESPTIQIYKNKTGEIVLVDYKNQIASTAPFYFGTQPVQNDSFKYNPAQVTYTGVTVSGVHMGGFNIKEAHYTQSKTASENGIVYCNYAQNLPFFLISRIKFNNHLLSIVKGNKEFKKLIDKDGFMVLIDINSTISKEYEKATMSALRASDKYGALAMYSRTISTKFYPIELCEEIVNWLNQIKRDS